jgi:hypothetical protein
MDQITKTTNRFFVVTNSVDIDKYRSSNAPVIKAHRKKKEKERKKNKAVPEQVYLVVSENMMNGESWGPEQRI